MTAYLRVLSLLALVLGALSFAAAPRRMDGGHNGAPRCSITANTFHYRRRSRTDRDTDTCGDHIWANDTLKRTYTVKKNETAATA